MRPAAKPLLSIVHSESPLNAGPSPSVLRRSLVTPTEAFYVRSHGATPHIDLASFRLSVAGMVGRELRLSLEQLKSEFPRRTLAATLQCAGLRRAELSRVAPIPGVAWGTEPIGTAVWSGVALADVLQAAGPLAMAAHVELLGMDDVEVEDGRTAFGGSIELAKAMRPEVLLAWEMNGEPLPPEHGFPLRAVVGGYVAARSVKWLGEVRVQAEPSRNHFQVRDYRFLPAAPGAGGEVEDGFMLSELNVNAVITAPGEGERVPAGATRIQGYAVAGGDRWITHVEVSPDGGRNWHAAALSPGASPWVWRFWDAVVELPAGPRELAVRAWDSAANTQPPEPANLWNVKGYMCNAWHRVRLHVEA
jgi:sulfite oxidase